MYISTISWIKNYIRKIPSPLLLILAFLLLFAAVGFTLLQRGQGLPGAIPQEVYRASPTVTWSPKSITSTLSPGESKTTLVTFTSSEDIEDVLVHVVPELQPYVQVEPSSFAQLTSGEQANLSVTISAGPDSLLGTFEGTIHLRDAGSKRPRTFARPLPVAVNVWQEFSSPNHGLKLKYPSDLSPEVDDGQISLFAVDQPLLPPPLGIEVFKPLTIPSAEDEEEFLQKVVEERLGTQSIIRFVGFHDGGLEVEADTFFFRHFFLYDSESGFAAELVEGQDGFFSSEEFTTIVGTITLGP